MKMAEAALVLPPPGSGRLLSHCRGGSSAELLSQFAPVRSCGRCGGAFLCRITGGGGGVGRGFRSRLGRGNIKIPLKRCSVLGLWKMFS